MHRSAILLIVLFIFLALSPFAVLANATIVVNTTSDEDGAGSSCSLREAITAANSNANYGGCVGAGTYASDTITFSAAVFNVAQTITLTSDLPDITSNITLTGSGANLLTIHASDVYQVFTIGNSALVTMSGITISHGYSAYGSAIYLNSGTLTLNNAYFSYNLSDVHGGAIYNNSGASLIVNNSTFEQNGAQYGAAIYSLGNLRVNNSTFFNNIGGAVYSIGASSVIGGSLFYDNSGNYAGAFYGIGSIFNSTFYRNVSSSYGGAIAINETGQILKLIHVTVADNTSPNEGDGVYAEAGTISIMNSIIVDNGESDCYAFNGTVNANYSLIESGCGITNGVSGNLATNAFLDPNALQNNGGPTKTLALSPASPAANAGNNSYRSEATVNVDFNGDGDKIDILSIDQRGAGFPRTNNTTVDMGAFETNTVFTGLTVDTTSDATLYACTNAANDCSLRGAILLANGRTGTDTISFATSIFSSPQTITLSAYLPEITSSIIINGTGANLLTVSGGSAHRHFYIENGGSLSINNLRISNGSHSSDSGGAFYVLGNLSISNSRIESNFSNWDGGAVFVGQGTLTVTNSSFSNNFSNSSGGAIFVYDNGTMRVTNSSFTNNISQYSGGAIYSGSAVIVGGSTFSSNLSASGGALRANGGTVFNSTYANNNASYEGGAINNDATLSMNLINVTISNNSASGQGGGVYTGNAALFVMNSIIADSTSGGDCRTNAGVVAVFSSIVEDGGCGVTTGSNGNIAEDAFLDLDGLQNNGGLTQTIALAPSSPAINAGSNAYLSEADLSVDFNGDGDITDTLSTDQRGTSFNRILNTTVDMGAFEAVAGGFTGLVVDTTSDTELFDCTNAAEDCSLRSAIRLANARPGADTITFAPSVFGTSKIINLNGEFPRIHSDITITGSGVNLLTIDGAFSYRPFYIENNALVSISALRVTHAASGLENGAAVYVDSGSLTLINTTFSNNEAATGQGGVIYGNTGSIVITNSNFTQNVSFDAGGVIAVNTASLTISGSSFTQNSANTNGGVIFNDSASILINNSNFANNTANGSGGAIFTYPAIHVLDSRFTDNYAANNGGAINAVNSYATIVGSSFGENSAEYGGALAGWMKVVNSSFAANSASTAGGAIYADSESLFLRSVSISSNSAGTGGGLYSDSGALALANTIVANSTSGGDCAIGTASFTAYSSIIEDGSCGLVDGINGNKIADPMFDTRGLRDNGGLSPSLTIALASPAINAGDASYLTELNANVDFNGDGDLEDTLSTDQRGIGFNRVSDNLDIGAIEQSATLSLEVDTTSDTNLFICTTAANDCSLRGAITIANGLVGANTISFEPSLFAATVRTINLTSDLPSITDNLTISGTGQNFLTINGAGNYRPFFVDSSSTVNISDMTITQSKSAGNGGALYVNSGTVTIGTINFVDNDADGDGGAIYNNGTLRIVNSRFADNVASFNGGAIYANNSTVIGGSSFYNNRADNSNGGAILVSGQTAIFNSVIYANNASGGALYNEDDLKLVNVTITMNGGAAGLVTSTSTVSVWNTISAENEGIACSSSAGNLSIHNSLFDTADCGMVNEVNGNIVGASFLDPRGLADNGGLIDSMALGSLSPAINAGSNNWLSEATVGVDFNADLDTSDTLTTDQRGTGFNRILNTTVDIGAFETNVGSFTGLLVDTTSDENLIFCTNAADDCSLRGAMTLANTLAGADSISFSEPVFLNGQSIVLTSDLPSITESLTITGTTNIPPNIDATNGQPFNISNGAVVTFNSIRVVNARTLTQGGAILVNDGNVTVNNSSFDNNFVFSGGAIYAGYGTTLTVNNSSFFGNGATSGDGGAINGATASTITITNSSFRLNNSVNNGGAIFSDSSVYVSGSSFSENTAVNGGALYANINANFKLFNSSIYANTASTNGGGIKIDGNVSLLHVTISANTAPAGGGLYIFAGATNIRNSIIANSTGGDCVASGTVIPDYSIIEDGGCGSSLMGDPYVAPFANYGGNIDVLGLLPFSPAINAGNNAYLSEAAVNMDFNRDGDFDDTLDTDQRGGSFIRLRNGTVDLGAFEAAPQNSSLNVAPIRNYYTTNMPTLTWTRISWATSYELQISTTTSFGILLCGGTISAANQTYTTCALPAGTYYWRVRAVPSTGTGTWSSVDVFVIGGP